MQEIKKQDLIPKILGLIGEKYRYNHVAATAWNLTPTSVSRIINDENYPIPDVILDEIGYEKENIKKTIYRKLSVNK